MLILRGAQRQNIADKQLACTLAGLAGALNAAAFYSVGYFSANMTGNLSSLSDQILAGHVILGLTYFAIILAFTLGATLSSVIINIGLTKNVKSVFAILILWESLGMVPLGAIDLWAASYWRVSAIAIGLAALMGMQNAIATQISDAKVRSTHISGLATDIGIEIGHLLSRSPTGTISDELMTVRRRLMLHTITIASFLCGGVFGVFLYQRIGGFTFWIAAIALGAIGMLSLRHLCKTERSA